LASAMLAVTAMASLGAGQEHPAMPAGMSHEEHMRQMAEMKKRGNVTMGFDQDRVTHHFRLAPNGGSIEVTVNRDDDTETRQQIRDHLRTISRQFADGLFTDPIATHAEVPPGVLVMQARKARITYTYEDKPTGGRVVIATSDRPGQKAVHDFLQYQIREHETGDPLGIVK
jgi:hypothetical protein